MISKQQFVDWLKDSGDLDNLIIAVLLEQNLIEMPGLPDVSISGDKDNGNT